LGVLVILLIISLAVLASLGNNPGHIEKSGDLLNKAPEPEFDDDGVDRYAVVVGIADYSLRSEAEGWVDLNFADDDARDWTDHLEDEGYTVHSLVDHEATREAIMEEIEWMEDQEEEGNHCAFVYSGHGGLYGDVGLRPRAGGAVIVPYDVTDEGSITDEELGEAFGEFESDHIFFFFDSCYSGGLDEVAGPGRYVSQTCADDESGLDSPDHRNGLWTYWFLEYGLEDEGHDDLVTCFENVRDLAEEEAADSVDDYGDRIQMHPEQEYEDDGPFEL
jgi:hypothetical protein